MPLRWVGAVRQSVRHLRPPAARGASPDVLRNVHRRPAPPGAPAATRAGAVSTRPRARNRLSVRFFGGFVGLLPLVVNARNGGFVGLLPLGVKPRNRPKQSQRAMKQALRVRPDPAQGQAWRRFLGGFRSRWWRWIRFPRGGKTERSSHRPPRAPPAAPRARRRVDPMHGHHPGSAGAYRAAQGLRRVDTPHLSGMPCSVAAAPIGQ